MTLAKPNNTELPSPPAPAVASVTPTSACARGDRNLPNPVDPHVSEVQVEIPIYRKGVVVATAIVSVEDKDLAALRWKMDRQGYANRLVKAAGDNQTIIGTMMLHRTVMSRVVCRDLPSHELVDHINCIRLDCTRDNLRITDFSGNSQNRRAMNPTGLRGVTYHKRCRKWQAGVGHNGKFYYAGMYNTPEEAACAAARKRDELGFLSSNLLEE